MGVPAGDRPHQRLRHRGRLPDRPRRLRAARDPADRRGGRRRRPGPAAVGVRAARRRRAQRPGQAQGRRRRRRHLPGHPAAAAAGRRRARLRALLRRRPRPARARVRLPAPRRGRARPPARAAVGRRRLARPLVPRSASTSTGGAERVFRLSRVVGTPKATGPAGAFEPPADVDLADVVAGQVGGEEHLVVVRARPGTAIGLRRHATPARAGRRRRRPAGAAHHRAVAAGRPDRRLRRRRRRRGARRGPRRRDRPADPAGRDGGAAHDAPTGTTDRMTRLLALVPYLTARPEGVARGRGGPRLRRHRAAAAQRPRAALDVRPARLRPRRPHRPVLRGRPRAGHLHRRHGPAAAADHRRGGRARRRAAHPAGAARPRRARGGQPRAGQGLRGRRARRRPGHAGGGQRRRPRGGARRRPGGRWSASGPCTCTTTCPPATSAPSAPSTRCGCSSSTASWYLEAWCRRAEGVRLFRLDRVDDVVVLDEPAAPPPQAHERDVDNGVYQPEPGRPGGPAAAGPQRPLGGRLLPGRLGDRRSTTRPAASRSRCAPRTSAWARRLVASLGGDGAASTSRPSWPPRSPPTPGRRSRRYGVDAQPAASDAG